MKRILVFCSRDWRHPKAEAPEHYLRCVLAHIARRGHYVAWVAHWPGVCNPARSSVEIIDGIQVARMGIRPTYSFMARLMLKRMVQGGQLRAHGESRRFDVIFEAILGNSLSMQHYTELPVTPIVFRPPRRKHIPDDGPIIAPTHTISSALAGMGVGNHRIVHARFGWEPTWAGSVEGTNPNGRLPVLAVAHNRPKALLRAIHAAVGPVQVRLLSQHAQVTAPDGMQLERCASEHVRAVPQMIPGARAAYLGPGYEHLALDMNAAGIPTVCDDIPQNREFVNDKETGLLVRRREEAVNAIKRLVEDNVLRARLSETAQAWVERKTWDATANRIMETIEQVSPSEP